MATGCQKLEAASPEQGAPEKWRPKAEVHAIANGNGGMGEWESECRCRWGWLCRRHNNAAINLLARLICLTYGSRRQAASASNIGGMGVGWWGLGGGFWWLMARKTAPGCLKHQLANAHCKIICVNHLRSVSALYKANPHWSLAINTRPVLTVVAIAVRQTFIIWVLLMKGFSQKLPPRRQPSV